MVTLKIRVDRRTLNKLVLASAAAAVVPRSALPQVRAAPGMPTPRFVSTNGIRMAVYEQGSGIPVIFCHGFPELAFSWRHQLDAIAAAGFHAIAPDLRGYGLTDRPGAVADYASTEVCDDLAGMMDAMGLESAVFCGHDWGGFIADAMLLLYPQRCRGLVGVGSPHSLKPRDLPRSAVEIEDIVDKPGFNRFLQQPDVPDALFDSNVRRVFTTFARTGYLTADYLETLPEDSIERRLDLAAMFAKDDQPGEVILSEADLAYYVATFEETGFTGAINWYRAMNATIEALDSRETAWGVDVPYLYIWPEQDPIVRRGHEIRLADYIDDFEWVALPDCGHFLTEERPLEVNRILVDWLRRKAMPA